MVVKVVEELVKVRGAVVLVVVVVDVVDDVVVPALGACDSLPCKKKMKLFPPYAYIAGS